MPQDVRTLQQGQTLYCIGDLYHTPFEFEQPAWMVPWKNPETTRASRQALVEAALADDAILVAGHIPAIGRLQPTESSVTFVEV